MGGRRAPSWQRRPTADSRDADAVAGARHAHSIEDETWDRGTAGLSHAGMRRYQRRVCPSQSYLPAPPREDATRTCGRESAARARHAGGPHAKGAGRTRGGTAAEAARLAGRRGAEAEGARGEGQPGFDSWRALTLIPTIFFSVVTSRLALLGGEAGLHALPRIEPGLLRLSARVAPSPMSSGRRFEVWVLRKRTFKPSGPAHHRNTVR